MTRRDFLTAAALPLTLAQSPLVQAAAFREAAADVVIVGGGVGGCAAALAACRQGLRVILTEPTDWIGGQLTSQGVPPDEHPWIERFGCTASYRAFRQGVRKYYRNHFPLTSEARENPALNPGNGWVSRLCCEPRVALAVLEAALQPYLVQGKLQLLPRHRPLKAETRGDCVRSVEIIDEMSGRQRVLHAPFFIDATELGDLLPLTGTEHVVGAESQSQTGEPSALEKANPLDQQAFTWCFALEYRPGEDHALARPDEYSFWRSYIPALKPPWPGPLLDWETSHPVTLQPRHLVFDPAQTEKPNNLWTYRRIRDARLFTGQEGFRDQCLANWPQNDYWLGPLIGVSESEAANHLRRSRQLSLSLLYWMQTEAPRPDGGAGWKGLKLASDALGGPDGLAKAPYIRESRRIQAEFTVTENQVGGKARRAAAASRATPVRAAAFPDSAGVGAYRVDLHPSAAGRNYIDLESLPFQIPLGALIPRRIENLLPAAKNIGTTHITNGCYRLHPVEWNIGEAAGELIAFCLERKLRPRQVRNDPALLGAFQSRLRRSGFELEWPAETHPL